MRRLLAVALLAGTLTVGTVGTVATPAAADHDCTPWGRWSANCVHGVPLPWWSWPWSSPLSNRVLVGTGAGYGAR